MFCSIRSVNTDKIGSKQMKSRNCTLPYDILVTGGETTGELG